MKKMLSAIGTGLEYIFVGVFLVCILPLIIPIILFAQGSRLYAVLWSKVRHDPNDSIEIKDLVGEPWREIKTEKGFVEAFERLSDKLATLSGAKKGKLICEGFEILEDKPKQLDWTELTITQILETKHAEIELSLQLGAYTSDTGELRVEIPFNDEDYDDSSWLPVEARIIAPNLHNERHFTLWVSSNIWAVVGFLRGDVKFAQPSGQLWIHIPEHKLWMVQYKINGDDYGLRKNFRNSFARRYGRDKPSELQPRIA